MPVPQVELDDFAKAWTSLPAMRQDQIDIRAGMLFLQLKMFELDGGKLPAGIWQLSPDQVNRLRYATVCLEATFHQSNLEVK